MKVSVVGVGYVGLTTAVCLADVGHHIVAIDVDKEKIDRLNQGDPIIFEKGLEPKLKRCLKKGNLEFTTDYEKIKDTEITFIAVGTPTTEQGDMDLKYVEESTKQIAQVIKEKYPYHIVVVKSTVVPGVTKELVMPLLERYSSKKVPQDIGICMNPEFLREGRSIEDFVDPTRVIIGEVKEDRRAGDKLIELYERFPSRYVVMRTGLTEAEMIKFANNSFLATRVSFANEIGNICRLLGIDGHVVMEGMSLDPRFGKSHLKPGPPYGGSCLPKDIKGLISKAKKLGYKPELLESVENINERQKDFIVKKSEEILGSLKDKKIAMLGLSFKADSDDVRFSSAISVIKELAAKNAQVTTFDPLAMENAKKALGDISGVNFVQTPEEALREADCCIIATDWDMFKDLESEFELMKQKNIIDLRRVIDKSKVDNLGLNYFFF